MGKLFTPQDLNSGFNSDASLTANFEAIETALDKTLSRTGESPNNMSSDLDMNQNNILNAGSVYMDSLFVDGMAVPSLEDVQEAFVQGQQDITDAVSDAEIALEDDIQAADTTFQGYLATGNAYASQAEDARDAAQTAQSLSETAQAAAELAENNAETWAAGVNLPAIAGGDAGKRLQVNTAEDGYDLVQDEQTPPPGFYDVGSRQVVANGKYYATPLIGQLSLDISGQQSGVTIGPSGSGMDEIWEVLDDVPTYAKGLILEVRYRLGDLAQDNPDPIPDGQSIGMQFYRYDPLDDTSPDSLDIGVDIFAASGGVATIVIPYGVVPINPDYPNIFYAEWRSEMTNTQAFVVLKGYTY